MDPSLLHLDSLIGNLGLSPDFSRTNKGTAFTHKQKIKNKKGTQVVINVNGVQAEKRKLTDVKAKENYKQGYYAVFLDNNQVYFGKLRRFADSAPFISLKDVYYLHNIQDDAVLNVDLIKLGTEIHSPQDEIHINRQRVLFWEKLQDDGPIVTAILHHQER